MPRLPNSQCLKQFDAPVGRSVEVKCQPACKPGSVWPRRPKASRRGDHSSWTDVAARLMQPTRTTGPETARRLPFASPLFGLAPGGVYRAAPVASRAVGSYPTLSPLPRVRGGLLSVALSLGSPPPAVSRHRVSLEPGLSSPATFRSLPVRPPGRLAERIKGATAQNASRKRGRRDYAPPRCRLTLAQ